MMNTLKIMMMDMIRQVMRRDSLLFAMMMQRYKNFLEKPHNLPILTCFTEVSQNRGNDLATVLVSMFCTSLRQTTPLQLQRYNFYLNPANFMPFIIIM